MNAGELAELGFNLLNLGLDIAAVAGVIFPEPGTTAAGLARCYAFWNEGRFCCGKRC